VFPKEHAQFGKGCAHLRETVYSKDPAAAYIARYFAPILVDMAKVQKRKQTPPPVLSLQGNIFIPSAHVFDTDGERVGKVKGVPGNYLAKLKAMVKEKGIEPPPKGARDVSRAFGRGKAAFDRKDYPTAMAELKRVVEAKAPGEELEAARNMIEKVAEQAAERYDKGMDLDEERKLGSAIRAYRECVHMYPDT